MLVPVPPRDKSGNSENPAEPGILFPVVRLKVTLLELVPATWRRFQVPANFTLRRLHAVLQRVMGWKESPVHAFRVGDELFGMPSESPAGIKDSRWIASRICSRGRRGRSSTTTSSTRRGRTWSASRAW